MESLLATLRAVAEPTRLRLLALCARGELTVTELTQILGQSQPRVSRHLKLLCDAGLLTRVPESTWAFFSLADGEGSDPAAIGRLIADLIPERDPQIIRDRNRLDAIKKARAEAAGAYFRANAERWDRIRSLHVDEADVEQALISAVPPNTVDNLLDVGTGTARVLALFADKIDRGVGIDLSRDMLAVARANLEAQGLLNCQVRHADMYQIPFPDNSFDAITIHQVLHYADRPSWAIVEAARVLEPGGRLAIVDFAPHELEDLREEHAHRRLGFADAEVEEWFRHAGLASRGATRLPGDPLTVMLWLAEKPAPEQPGSALRPVEPALDGQARQ